jgi:hypothetical protein
LTRFDFRCPLGSVGLIAFAYGDEVFVYELPKNQLPSPGSWRMSYDVLEEILKDNYDNDGMVEGVTTWALIEQQEKRIRRRFSEKDLSDWYPPLMGAVLIQMLGSYRNEGLEFSLVQKLLREIYEQKKGTPVFEPVLRTHRINLAGFVREMSLRQNLPMH